MATSLPGRTVPAPVLKGPESASEHIRNALMILDPVGGPLTPQDIRAVRQRLVAAIIELERLA